MECLGRLFNKLFSNFTEKNIIQAYNYSLQLERTEVVPILETVVLPNYVPILDTIDILVRGNNKFISVNLENIFGVYIKRYLLGSKLISNIKLLKELENFSDISILCVGYKKQPPFEVKCLSCCTCRCECGITNCRYNIINCKCYCGPECANIEVQFLLSETMLQNESESDCIIRAFSEELNINIENLKFNLHSQYTSKFKKCSINVKSILIDIDDIDMSFTKNIEEFKDIPSTFKRKLNIALYGNHSVLKSKIEKCFENNTFDSNEEDIRYLALIPLKHVDNIFPYLKCPNL